MTITNRLLFLTLATSVAAPHVAAQSIPASQHRGPLAVMPFAFVTDAASMKFTFRAAQPVPENDITSIPPQAGLPTYAFDTLVARLPVAARSGFRFGAISAANDGIPRTNDGVPEIGFGNENWAAVVLSVSNQSGVAWPDLPQTAGGSQGSHLISYFFQDSIDITGVFPGESLLEVLGPEAGLEGEEDIQALDYSLGLINANSGLPIPFFAQNTDTIFFSVAYEWWLQTDGLVPQFALDGTNWVAADCAAIYKTDWDNSAEEWGVPELYRSRGDLQLLERESPAGNQEAVDALMIYNHTSFAPTIYYSTRMHSGDGGRNQLLTLESTGPKILRDSGPQGVVPPPPPLTTQIGLGNNKDVNSACGWDPEAPGFPTSAYVGLPRPYRFWDLSQQPTHTVLATPISLSIARRTDISYHPDPQSPTVDSHLDFTVGGRGASGDFGPATVWLLARGDSLGAPPTTYDPLITTTPDYIPILALPWSVDPADVSAPQLSWTLPMPLVHSTRLYFEAHVIGPSGLIGATHPVIIK